jgi:hypothetical protein
MRKLFFFLDKFGDLDHARNLIFYFSKKYEVYIFQNQLNISIKIDDYIFQKLNDKLLFFPKKTFIFYKLITHIRCTVRLKFIDIISYNILKLLTFFFEYKKISKLKKILNDTSSVIFIGHPDEKILNLKKNINFKTIYLSHAARAHKGFYNKNFENFLKKKYYFKKLDFCISNNYNHWNAGGIKNKPIFLTNPRYIKRLKLYSKIKNKINFLLLIDKFKQSYQGNDFYYVNKNKYKEVLNFLFQLNERITIKLHPSLNFDVLKEFIDLKKYNKNICISEKKTEELIAQSKKIIGFGSVSLIDGFIYEKKVLIVAHCLEYKSLFYECCPNNVSYNFNDFKYKLKNFDNLQLSKFNHKHYQKILGTNKINLFQQYEKIIC